jgi:hypothetical protein
MRRIVAIVSMSLVICVARGEPPVPDLAVVPMSAADVGLYLDVLRAAAAHNAHLTGDDKAAVDFTLYMQRHPSKGPAAGHLPTQAEMDQMVRNANLSARRRACKL